MKNKEDEEYAFDIDGNLTLHFSKEDLDSLDILKEGDDQLSIIFKDKVYNVEILRYSSTHQVVELKVNGDSYEVKYKTPLDELIDKLGLDEVPQADRLEVMSPMPGMVMKVTVGKGDTVERGDELLILEAMKMENAIVAEMDGIIGEIAIENDDAVEKGELLLVIENEENGSEES